MAVLGSRAPGSAARHLPADTMINVDVRYCFAQGDSRRIRAPTTILIVIDDMALYFAVRLMYGYKYVIVE